MPNGDSPLYQLDEFFPILGLSSGIFQFYSNCNKRLCKQTLETLIRCRVLGHLIWACTVCICPIKRMLGLYGLNKILIIMAGIHKMLIKIANREDPDQTASSEAV